MTIKDVYIENGGIVWSTETTHIDFQALVFQEWRNAATADGDGGASSAETPRPLTATERPAVGHQIQTAWKEQNGRFLLKKKKEVVEATAELRSMPTVASGDSVDEAHVDGEWKDVTDQRATRNKISKLLKLLGEGKISFKIPPAQMPSPPTETETFFSEEEAGNSIEQQEDPEGAACVPASSGSTTSTTASCSAASMDQHSNIMEMTGGPVVDIPTRPVAAEAACRSVSTSINYARQGRLYGREREQELLLKLYREYCGNGRHYEEIYCETDAIARDPSFRHHAEGVPLVLISGESGVGKSSLALTLQPVVLAEQAFFVRGKFEAQSSGTDTAFVTILRHIGQQLLSHTTETRAEIGEKITRWLGEEVKLLTNMAPELGEVLGEAPSSSNDHSEANNGADQGAHSTKRLEYASCCFLKAVASTHPVVLLLDDIQWAKPIAVDFLEALVKNVQSDQRILFVVTTRPDPQSPGLQQFEEMLKRLTRTGPISSGDSSTAAPMQNRIKLDNLQLHDIQIVLSDLLSQSPEKLATLSRTLHSLTKGNMFFLLELLRSLQQDELIHFDKDSQEWVCDSHMVPVVLEATCLHDLFRTKMQELPEDVQETLRVASCFGCKMESGQVSCVLPASDVESQFHLAAAKGLLVPCDLVAGRWSFAHDSIQEAAYERIPPEEREACHLRIGRVLWKQLNAESPDEDIFAVVRQLFLAENLVVEEKLRVAVASLCLLAGEKAAKSTGFQIASTYLQKAILFLGSCRWRREHYGLTLRLLNTAAEASYCLGQFEMVDELVEDILDNCRALEDSLQARATRVYALTTQHKWMEAIESALDTLDKLGEKLVRTPSLWHVKRAMQKTGRLLRGKSDGYLLRLGPMTDPEKLAAMQIMQLVFLGAYYSQPLLATLIVCRMVTLSVKNGLCGVSSIGFGAYAVVLSSGGRNLEESHRLGRLCLEMCGARSSFVGRVSAGWYGSISVWNKPLTSLLSPLQEAYKLSLATGDIEFAAVNASLYVWTAIEILPLPEVEEAIRCFSDRMMFLLHDDSILLLRPIWQLIQNFRGMAKNPTELVGKVYDVSTQNTVINIDCEDFSSLYRMMLAYHFGEYELARTFIRSVDMICGRFATSTVATGCLYRCLCLMAGPGRVSRRSVSRVRGDLKTFKRWSSRTPRAFLGKYFLIDAELARVTGDRTAAPSKYHCAVVHSRESGLLMDEALACELAGFYHASVAEYDTSSAYFREALALYDRWGGTAKTKHLRRQLSSIGGSSPSFRIDVALEPATSARVLSN